MVGQSNGGETAGDKHTPSSSRPADRHLFNHQRSAASSNDKRGDGFDLVDDDDDPRYLSSAFGKRDQQQHHFDEMYADDDIQQQHFGK